MTSPKSRTKLRLVQPSLDYPPDEAVYATMTEAEKARPIWMDDPALLPKKPPGR